jgi:GDSL-like Lipase/Acylhydrolase family
VTRSENHWSRRRSRLAVAVTVVLFGLLTNVQPVQAAPDRVSGIAAAGKADPAKKRPADVFAPDPKLPDPNVLPGTDEKVAPLTSELKPTAPKALAGASTDKGLAFAGGSGVRDYSCTPSIYGSTYVGNDSLIGPYSDTYYTADVSCNFFLEYIYGVSAAVDWSPYYEGEIGYVGTAFEGAGSYGASQGAFEVQGDRYDGGRAVEVILEMYLVASAPWAACNPVPGLRYLACDGLGTLQLHVVLGTGPFGTGLAPPVIRFVSLGDSYSAGNGAPTNVDVSTAPDCRRSTFAYPYGLTGFRLPGDRNQPLPIDLPTHKACSGARYDHFIHTQPGTEREQRGWLNPYRTRLVTITLGGNDLGFSDRLTSCFLGDCAGAPLLNSTDLDAMQLSLTILYRDILRNIRPDGRVVVLSYPAVLPNPNDSGDYQKNSGYCLGVDLALSNAELSRIYEAAYYLNQMIGLAVTQAGDSRIQFVDNLNAFRGHRVCAPDGLRYAAGITIPTTSDTFHPNEAGYGQMAAQIRSQTGIR